MWTSSIASNMNFPAPVAVLGFLAACGGLALSLLAIITALFVKRPRIAKILGQLVLAGAVVYFGLLLALSLFSHERTLARGQEKYFCEIDCHLAYSIQGVHSEPAGKSVRYLVILRTRFDENTISSRRPKDAPLEPNPRTLRLGDDRGRKFALIAASGTPLTASLIPGQSYTTQLQFDVPTDAGSLRLLITSRDWPQYLLIGDELSPLHAKTWLEL
ncbi:MAG TPA: hypothetical protein VGF06_02685 [Terriglobales bacterium]|jgi:hypothetical protein